MCVCVLINRGVITFFVKDFQTNWTNLILERFLISVLSHSFLEQARNSSITSLVVGGFVGLPRLICFCTMGKLRFEFIHLMAEM